MGGFGSADDANSYFIITEGSNEDYQKRGTKVPCGAIVRLQHSQTKKYLASNVKHKSPLSSSQEVHCLAATGADNGSADWQLICASSSAGKSGQEKSVKYLVRNDSFRLKHVASGNFLTILQDKVFPQPIQGQKEIVAQSKLADRNLWVAREGIYFAAVDEERNSKEKL